jgi:high affinity Mn2+ porin
MKYIFLINFLLLNISTLLCQNDTNKTQQYNFHFQQTTIIQYHPSFSASYTGKNSLNPDAENATSLTSTFFFGLKIFNGTEIYLNPELSGGNGLSGTTGMAGFPNGEIYRVSNPQPTFSLARLFIRKSIGLGGASENLDDSQNQLSSVCDSKKLVITLGKFSLSDIFDDNSYSHDPRSQFINWALMSSVAWDYPADTKGYTYSVALEYIQSEFALRGAIAMVPKQANGMELDTDIKNAFGLVLELEKSFFINNRKGITRILVYQNRARMGSYQDAINNPVYDLDITKTDAYGRTKTGFAVNNEYSLTDNLGTFLKYSWNDGKNETWAFTEVDRALSLGFLFNHLKMIKKDDEIGLACAVNGLSDDHKEYLSKGGYGFIIGDGALNYGYESIFELYYKTTLFEHLSITPDYQFVINPAYNKDRGPVNIFSLRAHIEL